MKLNSHFHWAFPLCLTLHTRLSHATSLFFPEALFRTPLRLIYFPVTPLASSLVWCLLWIFTALVSSPLACFTKHGNWLLVHLTTRLQVLWEQGQSHSSIIHEPQKWTENYSDHKILQKYSDKSTKYTVGECPITVYMNLNRAVLLRLIFLIRLWELLD